MAKSPTIQNKIDLLRMQRSATSWYRKDAPYVWPDYRSARPQYQIVDFESYVREGFNVNTLVYSAIMYKVRAMYQVPLRAYTGDEDHPEPLPPDHPLSKLVRRPNLHQSFAEFQGLQHVYINLSGNSYTYLDGDSPGKLPKAMYPLRPDRVFIVPKQSKKKLTEDALLGYLYVPEGASAWIQRDKQRREDDIREGKVFPILPQNMMHVKFPNPGDPLEGMGYGLSPLSPAAKSVDVDNKVTDFLNVFFKSGTMMMGVLSYDVPLDPNSIPGIRKRWQELYGGYENWANIGILDQGGKYQRITPTFDEMGFGELDERSETRALGPFGVPPILVGARIGLLRSTYCLPANARITTSAGPKFIIDIEPGDQVWSLVDGTLVLRKVIKQHRTGSRRIYKVKTKNRTLRASGNHPVLVRVPGKMGGCPNHGRHASYEWRRVDELTVKDRIVQPKWIPSLLGNTLPDGEPATEEFLQFCGAIIGDGTVSPGIGVRIAMPPNLDRCSEHYQKLAVELFTKDMRTGFREPIVIQERERDFGFSSAQDSSRLDCLGFGGRALTKRIPSWVYSLNVGLRLACLAGLVDSDGSIDKRGVLSYSSAHEQLTLDVRDLLLSVGIQCSNVYHHICGPEVLPQPGIREEYHLYTITASSAKQISRIPFHDPMYRERVNANRGRYRADGKDAQKAGLSDELGFYKVRSIETEEIEDVYDIEVEDGHSFIADGVIVHNSNFEQARKLCWEETLVPEANLFLVEYRDKLSIGDAFVGWDYTKVPAMRQNLEELAKVWAMLVQNGVPKDVASAVTGLDIPPLLDGQVIYMQANLIPVGEEGQPSRLWPGQQLLPLGEAAQEEPPEEDTDKLWELVKKKHS